MKHKIRPIKLEGGIYYVKNANGWQRIGQDRHEAFLRALREPL